MEAYITYSQALKESFCKKMEKATNMPNIITLVSLKTISERKYKTILDYFTEVAKFSGKKVVIFEDSCYIDFTNARNTNNPKVSYKLKFKYWGGNISHIQELNNDFIALDIPYGIVTVWHDSCI